MEKLPPVRRARGWRLYTEAGNRLLDMYCDGGRAVMGAKPGEQGKYAKALIDRGLASAYPSLWDARLRKALLEWVPDYPIARFYTFERKIADQHQPILRPFFEYLPIHGGEKEGACPSMFWARPPVAQAWSFGILLLHADSNIEFLPPEDLVPPLQLAIAARSIYDLIGFKERYNEAHWAKIDPFATTWFRRSGPWLFPKYEESAHPKVFAAALEAGILLSPEYRWPSLVPGEFDKGEAAPLAKISF
ncbi:MAG: hypothetical protein FD137_773 [Spirochaetes bacterium]|nr:MAG: hypothetical protein FD137_773 [Spirochaetota bacterium]